MRKRFKQQFSIGQKPISQIEIDLKNRSAFPQLVLALKAIFMNVEYNEKIFSILESKITKGKKNTGRPGMDLWVLFVLAQTRLCKDLDYDELHHMANNDRLLREIMGIEYDYLFGHSPVRFEYQNIHDNVSLLDDATVVELNKIVVDFGHMVFKKKEAEALRLKTDSFPVQSNVHFPTDYNLLWDSLRKCTDIIGKFKKKHPHINAWRKLNDWKTELKSSTRALGQVGKSGGKDKDLRLKNAASVYLKKANLFLAKLQREKVNLPLYDNNDLALHLELEHYESMVIKHIDLVDRRILKGETIPHEEKLFSIFETYTEWITKGKRNPSVELGKNFQITTDQYNLIVDYKIMENEVDKSTVIKLADRILPKYSVSSWSFDKGFFSAFNKEILTLYVGQLIMPKKGKLNADEKIAEHEPKFKKLRNKHSAIESNINELEHRGLDRCPDKGYEHFKRYLGLGVCAYNLKKIGAELIRLEREKEKALKVAA